MTLTRLALLSPEFRTMILNTSAISQLLRLIATSPTSLFGVITLALGVLIDRPSSSKTLSIDGDAELMRTLVYCLRSPDEDIRRNAARAISVVTLDNDYKSLLALEDGAIPLLITILSESQSARSCALQAIRNVIIRYPTRGCAEANEYSVLNAMAFWFAESDPSIQLQAARIIAELLKEAWAPSSGDPMALLGNGIFPLHDLVPTCVRLLSSKSPELAATAATIIAHLPSPFFEQRAIESGCVPRLVMHLNSDNMTLLLASITAIAEIAPSMRHIASTSGCIPQLVSLMWSESRDVTLQATKAISRLVTSLENARIAYDSGLFPTIFDHFLSSPPDIQEYAVTAFINTCKSGFNDYAMNIQIAQWIPRVIDLLSSGSPSTQLCALKIFHPILESTGPFTVLPSIDQARDKWTLPLLDLLCSESEEMHAHAVRLVARIVRLSSLHGYRYARVGYIPALERHLTSKSPDIRRYACNALEELLSQVNSLDTYENETPRALVEIISDMNGESPSGPLTIAGKLSLWSERFAQEFCLAGGTRIVLNLVTSNSEAGPHEAKGLLLLRTMAKWQSCIGSLDEARAVQKLKYCLENLEGSAESLEEQTSRLELAIEYLVRMGCKSRKKTA